MKTIYAIVAITLVSCLSPRKADKQLSNLQDKYPDKVAKACAANYPCTTVRVDTLYKDSLLIDTLIVAITDTVTDTIQEASEIIKYRTKVITKKVSLPVVIKYIEDSAKIKLLNDEWACKYEKLKKECEAKKDTGGNPTFAKLAALSGLLALFLFARRKYNKTKK